MFKPNGDAAFNDLRTIEAAQNADQTGRRQLWERQPGETAKAYAAFAKYRDLSSRRTLREVAELSHCSGQNIARWSRRWAWVARAQAYDVIEEERFREQCSRDRLATRRRQVQLGAACQGVAAHGVLELQAKIASGASLNLSPEQIAALLKVGVDIEGRGMGAEGNARFTKINVIVGGRHRYPDEPCGCKCSACASCHGESDGGTMDLIEGGDPEATQLSPC